MLYNKNNVRKTNDKKILHKVGKQWKVVSVALLMAIGGTAVATHAANAQSNNNSNNEYAVQSAITVTPQSAAPQSASTSTKPVSAVSYASGDNGTAAKYHASAEAVKSNAQSANDLVNTYVNSLNAKFPDAANVANAKIVSAQSAEASDTAKASSYANVSRNSANLSMVSALAAKSGLTTNDYTSAVANSANNNSAAVKSASDTNNAVQLMSSLANSLEFTNWASASAKALNQFNSISAKAALLSASTPNNLSSLVTNASNSVSANASALVSATAESASAAVEYTSAITNKNSSNASAANSNASAASSAAANAKSVINSANAASGLYSLAYSRANSVSAKAVKDSSIAADAVNAASYAKDVTSTFANSMTSKNSSAFVSGLVSAANSKDNLANYIVGSPVNLNSLKSNSDEAYMLGSMASADGVNLVALSNNASTIKSVASYAKSIASGNYSVNNLNKVANSVATSASSEASNVASASNAYAQANGTNVVLASYYASAYTSAASSEANVASNAVNKLNDFYAGQINNPEFNNAVNIVNQAKAMEANDEANAKAFEESTWRKLPKYITVTKNGLLHKSIQFGVNDAKLAKVEAGTQYRVLGMGLDNSGAVRYLINVNGKDGYFTSNEAYVKPTYLLAKNNNREAIKVTKNAKAYKEPTRKTYTGTTVKAGTVLKNATVVSVDGQYYGYSVVEDLNTGNFITANTNYVSVVNNAPANNASNNNNNFVPQLSFWN